MMLARCGLMVLIGLSMGCSGATDLAAPSLWPVDELRSAGREELYNHANDAFERYDRQVGDEEAFIYLTTLVPRNPVKGPSVYLFGGGPNSEAVSTGMVRQALVVYGGIAEQINFVSYAGSRSYDRHSGRFGTLLEERMERDGLPSFEADVRLLLEATEAHAGNGYIIQVGSLSTPIGLLALSMNDAAHRDCALGVFLAPWTHYYPTSFVYDPANKPFPVRGGRFEDWADGYRRMALEYMHIDETLPPDAELPASDGRRWLSSVRKRTSIDEDIFVGIPSFENRMDRQVAIDFFEALPTATVWKSDYDFHETMGQSKKVQDAVRAFLRDRLPLPPCPES